MTDRTAFVQGLRELADALEASPEIPLPYRYFSARVTSPNHLDDDGKSKHAKRRAAEIARAIPAKVDKQSLGSLFALVTSFGPIKLEVFFDRDQVCERVVTGTRTVTEEEPDPEEVDKLPKRTVTREVEDVEWRCPDSLLAPPTHDGAQT